jgi:hypothetical protein
VNERRVTLALFHAFLSAFATFTHVVEERSQVHFEEDTSVSYFSLVPGQTFTEPEGRCFSSRFPFDSVKKLSSDPVRSFVRARSRSSLSGLDTSSSEDPSFGSSSSISLDLGFGQSPVFFPPLLFRLRCGHTELV